MSLRINDDKVLEKTKPFELALKIKKILNYMFYQFIMIDI